MTNGTPASSQIIAMENMVAQRDAEIERLRDLADEYNRLMRHMDAGGDFYAFQVAEAGRRNAPVPNSQVRGG